MNKLIILLLTIGIVFRLSLTSGGDFIFNMDNARDYVDIREMVSLHKLRLTGPTSAIDGLYTGPAWYYLLAIPYIISGGDPYSGIIMEIILWAIGGFFLLKLASEYGKFSTLTAGSVWIGSNYVVLANSYTFNPNPVLFLTPLFIFLIEKFINTEKFLYAAAAFLLGGLFFNFEMNAGIFTPLVIFFSVLILNKKLILKKSFWASSLAFVVTLLPQILFDLKHNFIMSNSLINFLKQPKEAELNPLNRFFGIFTTFRNTLSATLMNNKFLTDVSVVLFSVYLLKLFKKAQSKDSIAIICTMIILVPFIGYLLLPVQVNPWHVGAPMAAAILIISILLSKLRFNFLGKLVSFILSVMIIYFGFLNLINHYTHDRFIKSNDPSQFVNEVAAIDYVYKYANGKNFKVYTYLPSVYDYPYQYLFWWYGQKTYGYIPGEYVYLPNKPQYIPSQDKFQGKKDNFSELVFLIKEPDRIGMRGDWEDQFKNSEFVSKEMVGPIEVEIRKEVK